MKTEVNIYGFAVEVEYRMSDGAVEVFKTHIKDGTSASAISTLDIVSEAKEIIEAELLEEEDLMFDNGNRRPLEKDEEVF